MGEIADGVTVGVSYRSAVTHTLDGTLDFTLDNAGVGAALAGAAGILVDTDAETVVTTPDRISIGARVRLSEQWTALGEFDWTNWSRFQELRVVSDNPLQPDDVTIAQWEDFALRLHRPRISTEPAMDSAGRRRHRREPHSG